MIINMNLHGAIALNVIGSVALKYAMLSIERVATVRKAPKFDEAHEQNWRIHRDTLLSIGVDLPEVGEPEWPLLFDLDRDYEITKQGKRIDVGGIGMIIGTERGLRKGAKKKPTYSGGTAKKHAEAWRDEFMKQFAKGD